MKVLHRSDIDITVFGELASNVTICQGLTNEHGRYSHTYHYPEKRQLTVSELLHYKEYIDFSVYTGYNLDELSKFLFILVCSDLDIDLFIATTPETTEKQLEKIIKFRYIEQMFQDEE